MKKSDRAKLILKVLNDIYPDTPVPLNHSSIFELLIAVLLSAQCTDVRVNKVTPKLFSKANNPYKMKKIPLETIYNIVKPCGLAPKKSRAIKELSSIIVKDYNGQVPESFTELEKLRWSWP